MNRRATYDDLVAAPEHLIAEIIDGRLLTRHMPSPIESITMMRLGAELERCYGCRKARNAEYPAPAASSPNETLGEAAPTPSYLFLWKPELHLGEDVVVPTMAAWTKSRIRSPMLDTWFGFPYPEWIAEIVAHSAPVYELEAKLGIYARAGIAHYWFIDPWELRLDAYELVERTWLLRGRYRGSDVVRAAPFKAATFPVCDLLPRRYRDATNQEV